MKLNTVAELIDEIRQGRMIVLMDDESRENEGDLVMAATHVTPEAVNFMATHARGLICLTLLAERCEQLGLRMMVEDNRAPLGTNFTTSIDAAKGISTGISAMDRAHTIRTAVAAAATPEELVQPGHVFPLRAEPGGVLTRAGHTEAGSDLARLAGLEPAAVIVEIMCEDGTMARREDLLQFADRHGLKIGTVAELIQHRILNERTVVTLRSGPVTTRWGDFCLHSFRDTVFGNTHLALVLGEFGPDETVPVRVHVPALIRDVLGIVIDGHSGWTVPRCLRYMAEVGKGVLVLLGRQGTPEELVSTLSAVFGERSESQPPPQNITMMVGLGAQILRDLGVTRMEVMAQPARYVLSGYGLEVERYLSYDEVRS